MDADDTSLGTFDLIDLVHSLLVLVGDDLVGPVHCLTILTSLETPLDVLRRSLVQVVIDMSEGMLLDVGDTDILVGIDITLCGDEFTSEYIDQGRFACTVGTDNGNTRTKGALEGNVGYLGLGGTRVLELHLANSYDGLRFGLYTFKETRLRELELDLGGAKLVVGLGRRALLDELGQVASVSLELESLVVNDVLADVVQETRVVGDDDGCAGGGLEVVLEPLDVLDIQVVGGLVKQQNIGVFEDGTGKGELHFPSTRQSSDQVGSHLRGEAEFSKTGFDLGLGGGDTNLSKLLHGPGNGGLLGIGSIEVVLDEDGLDFTLLGETLDLLVVDGTHESGLSGTVGAAETISLATLQAEMGLVEEDLGTISQIECAVTEILAFLIISLSLVLLSGTRGGAPSEGVDDTLGIIVADDGCEVGLEVAGPALRIGVFLVDKLSGNGASVFKDCAKLGQSILVLGREDVLEDLKDGGNITSMRNLGDLAILDRTDTDQGIKTLLGLLTSLGVGEGLVVLGQARHQLGQERGYDIGVLNKLAHVVYNDGRLSLDSSLALSETTIEQGNHNGQGWLVDVSNEGGGTE